MSWLLIPLIAALVLLNGATGDRSADRLAAESTAIRRTLIVYYFHRTIRCAGCLEIERVAREALTKSFRRELKIGRIQWRPVNLDEGENEAFEKRYRLDVQTLVLSETIEGNEVRWKRLDDAWEYQHDPAALDAYIVRSIHEYIEPHTKEH